jgi:GxxExxY protein
MTENEIAQIIVDRVFHIHTELGPGLLESVYEEILYYELSQNGFFVEKQKPIPVIWKEVKMDVGFRADLIVERKVLVELKSVEAITPLFPKITLNYLKMTKIKLGLLINFNVPLIKDGIQRIVNNL